MLRLGVLVSTVLHTIQLKSHDTGHTIQLRLHVT